MPGLRGLSGSETCILWRRVSLASAFKEYLLFYHDTMQTITEVMWGWFFRFLFAIFHYNCETSKKFQRALLRPKKHYKHQVTLRLVSTADETTITMILQINDHNGTHNIYISSKNLLMFKLRIRLNNRYTKFTLPKSR